MMEATISTIDYDSGDCGLAIIFEVERPELLTHGTLTLDLEDND